MRKKIFEIILSLLCSISTLAAFEITGSTGIIITSDAGESTRFAAREMADYIRKSIGTAPEIVHKPGGVSSQIIIGTLKNIPNLPA